MSPITTIVAFTGSIRAESHNKAALRLAQELLPAQARLEILAIDEVEQGRFNEALQQADAILIATPEYKGLLSRVLKSALTQVAPEAVSEKPTAIIGVGRSSGEGREHNHLRHLLGELNASVLNEQVYVGAEQLNDPTTHQQIRALLETLMLRVQEKTSVLAN